MTAYTSRLTSLTTPPEVAVAGGVEGPRCFQDHRLRRRHGGSGLKLCRRHRRAAHFAMNQYAWNDVSAIFLGFVLLVWLIDVGSARLRTRRTAAAAPGK